VTRKFSVWKHLRRTTLVGSAFACGNTDYWRAGRRARSRGVAPIVLRATTIAALLGLSCGPLTAEDGPKTQVLACPDVNPATYALNGAGTANVNLVLKNLRAIDTATKGNKPIEATRTVFIKLPNKQKSQQNIKITLSEIIDLIKANLDNNRILAVPHLREGYKRTEHGHNDTVYPLAEGVGDRAGTTITKPFIHPHAYACIRGTLLVNWAGPGGLYATAPEHAHCPEGTILIDAKYINARQIETNGVLRKPTDYLDKAVLASLLAHEKAHELFLKKVGEKATSLGVVADSDDYFDARDQVIDEKTHKLVYDFQKQIVDAEKNNIKTYNYPDNNNIPVQDKENAQGKLEEFSKGLDFGTKGTQLTSSGTPLEDRTLERIGAKGKTKFSEGGQEQDEDAEDCATCDCPPIKETGFNPTPTPGTVYVSTDSTTYCTFGDGTGKEFAYTPADNNGDAITSVSYGGSTVTPRTSVTPGGGTTPGDRPQTPGTPPMTDKTPTPGTPPITDNTPTPGTPPTTDNTPTPGTPPITDKTPTPNTPPTTDNTPPPTTTTTDNNPTPTARVTIYIKASQAVLEGGQTGDPIQGQIVMLVLRNKPAVPSTAESKTANDLGYNKPAPKCPTGANGECKFDLPNEDLPLFALNQEPTTAGKPVNNFRVSLNLMKHNGGVVETTGRTLPDLKTSAIAANVLVESFKIGNRTFVRLAANTPYGKTDDLIEKFSKLFGVPVEVDICIIKEPGPPLGSEPASFGALNHELPQTSVTMRKSIRAMVGVP